MSLILSGPGSGITALPEAITTAVITARGGSKRLPGKNIRPLGGKPLIVWTIEAALGADEVDQVIVSTDDEITAEISRKAGAEIPFRRPEELSGDLSSHYDVIAHALDWLEADGRLPQTCLLLQPTSPFRTAAHIDAAIRERRMLDAESMASVSHVSDHPAFMLRKGENGTLTALWPRKEEYQRSQDHDELFVLNGAIYVFSPTAFRQRKTVLSPSPVGFVMDRIVSLDIDNAEDFALAEALMKNLEQRQRMQDRS